MSTNNWNSSDWTDLGQEIRDMVEQAVDSQDFGELSGKICNTVVEGLDKLRDNIQNSTHYTSERYRNGEAAGNSSTSYRERKRYTNTAGNANGQYQNTAGSGPRCASGQTGTQYRNTTASGPRYASGQPAQTQRNAIIPHPLYAKTTGEKAGGTALTAVGYTFAGGSSLAILIMALVGMVGSWGTGMSVATGILSIVFAGSSAMAWQGTKLLGRVRRFRKYVDGLKGRTYCNVEELAALVGKKEKYVVKDLRKMISNGWFRQGHLDRQEKCLIVSNETYQQYQESQRQLEVRQRQEIETRKQEEKVNDGLTPEVREMIRTGNEYIRKIEKSNDAIPGEEISNKIDRMQMIVEKIFQRVKERPEYASDLRKFMDYYLPTTVKLLDAYEELDRQPVQGENIQNSRQEIEKTLDTLNIAFEKLLDSLFEDTAWDVSTDISVLKTMLAQEGLTESGFRK